MSTTIRTTASQGWARHEHVFYLNSLESGCPIYPKMVASSVVYYETPQNGIRKIQTPTSDKIFGGHKIEESINLVKIKFLPIFL